MPDPAQPARPAAALWGSLPPPPPRPPRMMLVDRYVRLVDELEDVIQESGAWQLDPLIESVLDDDFPDSSSPQQAEQKRQEAIEELLMRYRVEVEDPALGTLRRRKARCPSALRKEPVAFSCAEDPAYYTEVLDGIELDVPDRLADAPSVNSLTLRISWPPDHHLRSRPPAAFIAGCDEFILVLYVGTYRPCLPQPGFYLVYNSWVNSVAIAPPLSCRRVNFWTHCNIGGGVAVLNICSSCYVLAELLLRKDERTRATSNKATLFLWWSPGSGPLAGRWIQKEVVLPLPADEDYSFRADIVFAAAGASLCWVDLLTGILVCHGIDKLAAGIKDCAPVFHFIPLPPKCAMKTSTVRGQPEEHRSMCPINYGETFKFVSMVGYSEDRPIHEVMLTTWTLKNPISIENWEWEEDATSFCIRHLWDDPIYKDDLKLQPLTPSFPVLSTQQPGVIYLSVTDYEYKHGQEWLQATGSYQLSLDMHTRRLISAIKFPSDESGIVPHPTIFTSHFGSYLDKTREWVMLRRARVSLRELSRREELADEGELGIEELTSYERLLAGVLPPELTSYERLVTGVPPPSMPDTTRTVPMWSMPYTVGRSFITWKFRQDKLNERRFISFPSAVPSALASSFCPEGLQLALDATC